MTTLSARPEILPEHVNGRTTARRSWTSAAVVVGVAVLVTGVVAMTQLDALRRLFGPPAEQKEQPEKSE